MGQAHWAMVLDAEALAEIDLAHDGVVHNFLWCAVHQNMAIMQDIGAVDDAEGFPHVVIGDQNAQATVLKLADQRAYLAHGDGVYAGKGLVQKDIAGLRSKASRDFNPPPFPARE